MPFLEDLLYWLCDLELVTYLYITSHLQNGITAPNILGVFEISFLVTMGDLLQARHW